MNFSKKQIIFSLVILGILTVSMITVFIYFRNPDVQNTESESDTSKTTNDIDSTEGFNIIQENIITSNKYEQTIKNTPYVNTIYALAEERGFSTQKTTLETIDESGVTTAITSMKNKQGQTALFIQTSGFGSSKADLFYADSDSNTLTTYNDDDSGLTTILETGEVLEKWGPVINHSDEYDFNVGRCLANQFVWDIGLSGQSAQDLFELSCGSAPKPSDLPGIILSALDWFDTIEDMLFQQATCVSYLRPIIAEGNRMVETGDISTFMADITFGTDINMPEKGVAYRPGKNGEPGKFKVTMTNQGRGYSGSFGLTMYAKLSENSEWRMLSSVQVDNLRPKNSNANYPYADIAIKEFNFSPQEGEIVSFKIDPHDIVEEREEENNQIIIGRDVLNQKPVAQIQLAHPNPTEVGKEVIFQAQGIDHDGHIASRGYEWDFGDGTKWRTERIINYNYQSEGRHTVKLRVQDAEGAWSDTVEKIIIVNKTLPEPKAQSDTMMFHSAFRTPGGKGDAIALNKTGLWILEDDKLISVKKKTGEKISETTLSYLKPEGEKYMTWDPSGYFWIIEKDSKTVFRANSVGELQGSYSLDKEPTGITWNDNVVISAKNKALIKLDKKGAVLSIHETPTELSNIHYDGKYYWATALLNRVPKIIKVDETLNILEKYPSPQEDADCESEEYINYPYRAIGFAREGKYLWILGQETTEKCWTNNKVRSAVIYKADMTDYRPPYEQPIPGQSNPMVGMAWDGDAFIVAGPTNARSGALERIAKKNLDGSYVTMLADEIDSNLTFLDVARDHDNLWVLAPDRMLKLSPEGKVLETFDLTGKEIKTITYHDHHWWLGGNNKIYRADEKGNMTDEYNTDVPDIADIAWANDTLWISGSDNRVYRTEWQSDYFHTTDIFLPDSLYTTSGKNLGYDGKSMWYTSQNRIYRLDHIEAGWGSPDFQTPIFTTSSRQTSIEGVNDSVLEDICYAVQVLPEDFDGERKYSLVRQVEALSPNEIYFTHGPVLKKFDGSSVIKLGKIETVKEDRQGILNIYDMAISPQTGEKFVAYEDALMYHDGAEWKYIPGAGGIEPYSLSATDNGAVFIAGVKDGKTIIAKYQNGKVEIQFEYPDKKTNFPKIQMVSDKIGYAAFHNEIYSYSDEKWRKTSCEVPDDIKAIYFNRPTSGFIGTKENIYKFNNNQCEHKTRMLSGFMPTKIYSPSDTEFFVVGDDFKAKTSFFYYDGKELSSIWLSDLIQSDYEREYDQFTDLDFIPNNGLTLSGYSANLIICPDIKKVIDHAQRKIQIKDGKVVSTTPSGSKKEIIKPANFEKISKFIEVYPDPYKYHMCFIGEAMMPKYIFISEIDGNNFRELGSGKECIWSHDGLQFVYTNYTSDISPVDISYVKPFPITLYNLTKGDNLADENTFRTYSTPQWSADDTEVIADFTEYDTSGQQWSYQEGTATIHMDQSGRPITVEYKEKD